VQRDLVVAGLTVPWPALIVAAVAERGHVTLLHHDIAFDLIAKVTDQLVERIP
jgi:predicted nucleic acid-binding protein